MTDDEAYRVNRVRVAAYLGCMPGEVDRMSSTDYQDVLLVIAADEEIERLQLKK